MEQAKQVVVMTREDLTGLIEEVINRLRKMDDQVYDNRRKKAAETRVYTPAEAGKILMCSSKDVTGFIRKKILHASMFNRQYCIGEKSLIAFIVQNPLLLLTK